ncbi:unnamed protein product [Prunus armeniaca]|uniref:Uncharacterized protein n=1 Tax=Prunus armeniaca TaxID=36596 RepID=A0A6J5W0Y0_PRUAR|nr:unnamed protein product [Prunus armeniaca]
MPQSLMPTSMGSPTTQTLPNLSTNTGPSFILDPSISGHHPSIPSISGHHPSTYIKLFPFYSTRKISPHYAEP